MLPGKLSFLQVLPVATELLDMCGLLLRGLQCLQGYIHGTGRFCFIWKGMKKEVHGIKGQKSSDSQKILI